MSASYGLRNKLIDSGVLAGCVVASAWLSVGMGQDANWDLQNYHFYNPWAWWNGRIFTWDVAAAQLQTYHNALLDLPFFAVVAADWPPQAIAAANAIPAGIAAFLLYKLLGVLFTDLPRGERLLAIGCAFAIGVTSAIGIGVLGTTMNEWPLVALTMPALWLLARALVRLPHAALPRSTLLGAGFLSGLAAGLKLTAATFAVGMCLAVLLRGTWSQQAIKRSLTEAFTLGLGVLVGVAIALGPWAWQLWTYFDSPIFPYGNQWIKSPWWGEYEALARRYGPHTLEDLVLFPFRLLAPEPFFVAEVPVRDARMPTAYLLAILAGAAWWSHRFSGRPYPPVQAGVTTAWRLISIFFLTSFLLWTWQHSVYRYLLTLDLLTGALIVRLLWRLLRPGYFTGIAVVLSVLVIATTRVADWRHIEFGERWFDFSIPKVRPNALILITTSDPISMPYFPSDARHLGVENTINAPWRRTKLAVLVAETIARHVGPLYAITHPIGSGVDALLAHEVSILTETCQPIVTRMQTSPISICRVVRTGNQKH